jgi:hypothetical protein
MTLFFHMSGINSRVLEFLVTESAVVLVIYSWLSCSCVSLKGLWSRVASAFRVAVLVRMVGGRKQLRRRSVRNFRDCGLYILLHQY